jgi:hypothetical protein
LEFHSFVLEDQWLSWFQKCFYLCIGIDDLNFYFPIS